MLGLLGVLPLWKVVEPVIDLFVSGSPIGSGVSRQLVWLYVLLAILVTLAVVLSLRRIAKTETRRPFAFGWAVSGQGRRITLEKIRAGTCPKCGGKLKYFNKPTRWIDHVESNGRRKREVTERVPALECRRSPKHWYEVDPAEGESF